MCLHGALSAIPFNLICRMTTFSKKKFWPFDPHPKCRGCMYGQNMCLHGALCSIPFHLICNLTTLKTRPNSALDLRRGSKSSMCKQSICKVQINRNEIRLHPNFAMLSTVSISDGKKSIKNEIKFMKRAQYRRCTSSMCEQSLCEVWI